jgi:hypothetical protein
MNHRPTARGVSTPPTWGPHPMFSPESITFHQVNYLSKSPLFLTFKAPNFLQYNLNHIIFHKSLNHH